MLGGRVFFALLLAVAGPAQGGESCLLLADPAVDGVLLERGDCDERVTPASTFKIALAVMGFEDGFLTDADHPVLTWQAGEPDWGGPVWRGEVTPRVWMAHSVVWYSQRIARALGKARLSAQSRDFGYGNADFEGDPGRDNGIERAWIGSSLKVSGREQARFLSRLVTGELPARPGSMAAARGLVQTVTVGGWVLHGKTGSAFGRGPDGSIRRDEATGWFVGWAESDGRMIVFVRLDRSFGAVEGSPGQRARAGLLDDWPGLVGGLD